MSFQVSNFKEKQFLDLLDDNLNTIKSKKDYESCYNSKTLELVNKKNLVLELTQENSMEFLVQSIYLYILTIDGLCLAISSLP